MWYGVVPPLNVFHGVLLKKKNKEEKRKNIRTFEPVVKTAKISPPKKKRDLKSQKNKLLGLCWY